MYMYMYMQNYTHCISFSRYAAARIEALRQANQLTPRSRFATWQPVTVNEFHAFLAVILNMGLIDIPTLEGYWSTSWESEIPFFRRVMPRDRFLQIFWMLHVGDGEGRVDKVKKVCDALIHNFQAKYQPAQNLAVDETMVGFRGRFAAKQYMPNKPTKYGIKAFTLASSDHGYLLNVLLYTGADTLADADQAYSSLPQPARVVMHLLPQYLGKGHHVYTDRYYSSIPLAQALALKQTHFTGTMMKNRVDLPDTVRASSFRLRDDEVRAFRAGSLLTVAWRAATKKKPLIMLSSSCANETVTVRSRRTTQRKPVVVDRYNHCMNGVDRADQYTAYYSFIRRSVKWWRKVFFWLMEVAVVNSYILYKCSTVRPLSHREYRSSVVRSLATSYVQTAPPRGPGRRPRPRSSRSGDPERLNRQPHFMERGSQRDCVVCSHQSGGNRRRTTFFCKTCPSHPPLCPAPCYERYQTVEAYKV